MIHLTQENFDDAIARQKSFVVFGAAWCGYCRVMEPVIEEIAAIYVRRVQVAKVDADVETALVARFGITIFPTFLVFERGVEVNRTFGAKTLEELEQMIG